MMLPEPVFPPAPPLPADVLTLQRFSTTAALIAHHTKMIKLYAEWLAAERLKLGDALGCLEELLADAEASLINPFAQAIEARRAATGTGAVHESAVATPCAQGEQP